MSKPHNSWTVRTGEKLWEEETEFPVNDSRCDFEQLIYSLTIPHDSHGLYFLKGLARGECLVQPLQSTLGCLHPILECLIWVLDTPLPFSFLLMCASGGSRDGSWNCIAANFWLCPGPVLAIVDVWGMKKQVENFCLSFFQVRWRYNKTELEKLTYQLS